MRVIYVSNLCLPKVYDSLFENKCCGKSNIKETFTQEM